MLTREILPFAFALPLSQSTWTKIETAGPELDQTYWGRLRSFGIPKDEDFGVVISKYLAVGRGRAALEMIGGRRDITVCTGDILRVLRDPSTVKPADERTDIGNPTMVSYYIAGAFRRLDADGSVTEDELVGLEWTYFNVLQDSERPAKTLHKALSKSPAFFVQLLSSVFLPEGEEPPTNPQEFEAAQKIATQAFRVLENWNRVPGSDDAGVIDGPALEAWVAEARRLCRECNRTDVGDNRIGRILSAARRVPGEAWPPEPVRDVIETCKSRDLEQGFQIGLFNRRGVTVRMPTDGGRQERDLAAQYRADALACA
jgi:hypothetical protein